MWPWKKEEEDEREVHFPNVQVIIKREAYEKLKSYVLSVDTEITGLGIVKKEGNIFYIPEVFLLDQKVTSGSAELEAVAISKLMNRLIKEGQDPSQLKFWWHSHASMGAFWSGTDDDTCEKLENKDFSISLVINKRLQCLCRLDLYHPLRITVDRIKLQIQGDYAFIDRDPKDEIAEKVKEEEFSYGQEIVCPKCLGRKNNEGCPECFGWGTIYKSSVGYPTDFYR